MRQPSREWRARLAAACGLLAVGAGVASEGPSQLSEVQVRAYLKEHLPMAVPALEQAKELDAEAYGVELERVRVRILEIEKARVRSPEIGETLLQIEAKEFQVRALAQGLSVREEEPTAEQLAELRGVLEEIFGLRVRLPELEMAILEGEVRRIRERLEAHRVERDRVVQERLDAILADPNRRLLW